MVRSLFAFAALLLGCAVLAAPAPEPFVSGWNKPVDPSRDCKIRRHDGTLIIEMPGTDHDYDPIRKRVNAPRILRDLKGNFDLQVRVQIDCRPSAQSTVKDQPSFVSAGFLLIYTETGRFICDRMEYGVMQHGIGLDRYTVAPTLPWSQLERASRNGPQRQPTSRKGIGEDGFAVMKSWSCKKRNPNMLWDRERLGQSHTIYDRGWKNWPLPKKTDYAYLRLERHGGGYYFYMSPDGEKWTRIGAHLGPPAELKLGLAAYSTSSEPSKVRFDRLKLTRGKRKEPQRRDPLFEPSTIRTHRPYPSHLLNTEAPSTAMNNRHQPFPEPRQ